MRKSKIIFFALCFAILLGLAMFPLSAIIGEYRALALKSDAGEAVYSQNGNTLTVENGYVSLRFDNGAGSYETAYEGKVLTSGAYSEAYVKAGPGGEKKAYGSIKSESRSYEFARVSDLFGNGARLSVENLFEDGIILTQRFYVYDGAEYLVLDMTVRSASGRVLYSNDMRQVFADGGNARTALGNMKRISFLETPFDNNEYEDFSPQALGGGVWYGYGFSMLYNQSAMEALIIGAIDNGVFKNALVSEGRYRPFSGSSLNSLYMHHGKISYESRDYDNKVRTENTTEHGYISGVLLESPRVFYGYYADYRDGLEQYGDAAGLAEPPLPWADELPVGYNSWAALYFSMNYNTMTEMSDYVSDNLGNFGDKNVYLNIDSGFDSLTDEEKRNFVTYAKANGQKAGSYWTPFSCWYSESRLGTIIASVDGRAYTYREALLKDKTGNPILYGSAYSLDPTHPAVKKRVEQYLDMVISYGYSYIKMDFINNASMEGEYYDKSSASTGMEAFNYGMRYIVDYIAANSPEPIFLSSAISPTFSGRYIHARRISCDVFEYAGDTQYLLNTMTYAWWMNGRIITSGDPDHLVLYKRYDTGKLAHSSYSEAVSAMNSRVIAGSIMLWSDNLIYSEARRRAEEFLNNRELTGIAAARKAFRPLTSGRNSQIFYMRDGEKLYVAVFNFDVKNDVTFDVKLSDFGLVGASYSAKNLNTGELIEVNGERLGVKVANKGSAMILISRR